MHDALTIGIPVLAILFGILLNQRGLDRLEARLDRVQSELSSRLDRMQADLSIFYRTLGNTAPTLST
jgi:hypothetical protein